MRAHPRRGQLEFRNEPPFGAPATTNRSPTAGGGRCATTPPSRCSRWRRPPASTAPNRLISLPVARRPSYHAPAPTIHRRPRGTRSAHDGRRRGPRCRTYDPGTRHRPGVPPPTGRSVPPVESPHARSTTPRFTPSGTTSGQPTDAGEQPHQRHPSRRYAAADARRPESGKVPRDAVLLRHYLISSRSHALKIVSAPLARRSVRRCAPAVRPPAPPPVPVPSRATTPATDRRPSTTSTGVAARLGALLARQWPRGAPGAARSVPRSRSGPRWPDRCTSTPAVTTSAMPAR